MGSFGALFPGNKLRKENQETKGTGQGFQPGPLDLDSGVVYLAPRPTGAEQPTDAEEPIDAEDPAEAAPTAEAAPAAELRPESVD
ncbi:hypothetical protein [Goodfellowiella coeruleoviolacea]|nr:hypothetical protein [Goodfellowiella coeruleoviolacea]